VIFEVDIDGRTRRVAIESVGATGPAGGTFVVRIDDTPHRVTARPTDLGLSLVFEDDHRSVDVAVTERPMGEWLMQLPHVDIIAAVDRRRHERGRGGAEAKVGEQRILAPMPGRVVRVLAKVGDEVALRQGLIVIEAMKMENELTAPKAGKVKDVLVSEGGSVEAGKLLMVIE